MKYLKRNGSRVIYNGQEVMIDSRTKNTFIRDESTGKKIFVTIPKKKVSNK